MRDKGLALCLGGQRAVELEGRHWIKSTLVRDRWYQASG
jgi:hypothetical protein